MFNIGYSILSLFVIVQVSLAGSWYNWGTWSSCSRSCDGGVSFRQRMCYGRCNGEDTEYKLCNTQGCSSNDILPEHRVCNSYKNIGYNLRWVPRQTYQCSVFCGPENNQVGDLISVNLPDGYKCSKYANHYCINGKCVQLGCDGKLGSSLDVDECGICGGDGSSCKNNTGESFQWRLEWSFCSVSCGTGFETSSVMCRNIKSSQTVPNFFCDYHKRSPETVRECSSLPCEPRWSLGPWQTCSERCGGGVQKREVKCTHVTGRSKMTDLPGYRCPDPIPASERSCNTQFCPSAWQYGGWGECSVTCGVGIQTRPVYCMKSFIRGINVNVSDSECMGPKLTVTRQCSQPPCVKTIAFAPFIKVDNSTFIQLKKSKTIHLDVGMKAVLLPRQPVKIACPVENFDKSLIFWTKNSRLISTSVFKRVYVTSKGALKIKRTDPLHDKGVYTCIAGLENANVELEFQSKRSARQKAKKIKKTISKRHVDKILNIPQSDIVPGSGPQNIIAPPSPNSHKHSQASAVYITTPWSKCSRTCGIGFQTRKVTCNIVTEKYMKIVTDNHCPDKKPEKYRRCQDNPHCPVWNTGEWSECSHKNCKYDGLAVQYRHVQCVSEHNNSIEMPIKRCDQSVRPSSERQCPNEQCVAIWKTSKWSRCKPRCEKSGKKTRLLSCVWKQSKKPAQENCKSKPKPEVSKRCRPKYCKRDCVDSSRYCSITKLLRMCRYRAFMDKCCATCTNSVLS